MNFYIVVFVLTTAKSFGSEEKISKEAITKCYQGGIAYSRKTAVKNLTLDNFHQMEVAYCMGQTCTKVYGRLESNVSGVNLIVNIRDCDSLDHTAFYSEKKEGLVMSCDVNKATLARLFMHRALYTSNLQVTEYDRAYPYTEGRLMNTLDECVDLEPNDFPEYNGRVSGKLTFCCCTKRLCNSSEQPGAQSATNLIMYCIFIIVALMYTY